MSVTKAKVLPGGNTTNDETLFARIALDLKRQGYSIRPAALPGVLTNSLYLHQMSMNTAKFKSAGIGRGTGFLKNDFVRTDEICWITGDSEAGLLWLKWTDELQTYLNRRLFLGLFSFESHFAHYSPGDYYKRHYDAFSGDANRKLSIVAYLNPGWSPDYGGELVIYKDDQDKEGVRVVPLMGTLVVFLSEEFPHEVLPASKDRFSIAGWYRINTSTAGRIDPPL